MSEVYYLKDKEYGYIVAKFEAEDISPYYIDGRCFEAHGWADSSKDVWSWTYFAGVYCKWDSCTHWYFRGEDYDPDLEGSEEDSYYHICGGSSFLSHIRLMCFVWKLVSELMDKASAGTGLRPDISLEYFNIKHVNELCDLILDGYEIVKEGE